ncbi:transferase family protein [Hyaloscypha variabilis]
MFTINSFDVQVTSTTNIFPESSHGDPITTPLSIFDNASADFARCAAVWFYGPPSTPDVEISASHLQSSLSKTLNYYRQWCGRLSYAKPKANGSHNERYQRIWVTYNTSTDIGIPFVTATSPQKLSDFLPSISTRRTSLKAWDASELPASELLPDTSLSISEEKDAPNVIIQFTTFACGSTAVAIEITHCFADAVSLSQFAKDWSLISRAMLRSAPLPILTPVFDPQRLDFFAAGDIDASLPDLSIISKARSLPQHRYDWYLHVKDQPWPTHTPADFDTSLTLSPSTPIPWHQWDTRLPVSHRVLHFSPQEIQQIYTLATSSSSLKISKHDALLAYIWSRITLARQLPENTTVYLDMTFGLRPRVSPPLPDSFLGSPITHAAIPYTTSSTPPEISGLAQTIRKTLAVFTPDAVANHLHDVAFEVAPQRIWRACLGREHILLTTWVHAGVYEVEFGGGSPRYVEALMPSCDGLVEVMEAGDVRKADGGRADWISEGVDVSVYLESEAMQSLLDALNV